jgi:hypothetical protein
VRARVCARVCMNACPAREYVRACDVNITGSMRGVRVVDKMHGGGDHENACVSAGCGTRSCSALGVFITPPVVLGGQCQKDADWAWMSHGCGRTVSVVAVVVVTVGRQLVRSGGVR